MTASAQTTGTVGGVPPGAAALRFARRNAWVFGLLVLLAVMLLVTRWIEPDYGAKGFQSLAVSALPVAFAAVAQAIIIIGGGIDLSIGSMMALSNVTAAALMKGNGDEAAVLIVIGVMLLGVLLGAINGGLVVFTRVPDIVVTLAMSFVWAGAALLVLHIPGGSAAAWLKDLVVGSIAIEWLPKSMLILAITVGIVWIPLRRSKLGLGIYAVGSDRQAAYRSGVSVLGSRVTAYAIGGFFAAMGGLALTASTGIGTPVPGPYTLASVAAVVLGGVALTGGRGGVFGPIIAVLILRLVRTDLTFLGIDPNWATVVEGAIMVAVVMFGALVALRRSRS
jgi:ribose transport system permease protein